MTPAPSTPRKSTLVALVVCLLVLFMTLASLNGFSASDLHFLSPHSTGVIFLFTALSTLAFLLFVTIFFVLARNVLRLYSEQRSRVLGSRLRSRMVWGAVMLSLLPICLMFAFSYGLMNRAVERWFNQPVTQLRDDSSRLAVELSRYASANARSEAQALAASLQVQNINPSTVDANALLPLMRQREITLQGGFIAIYRDRNLVASFHFPENANPAVKDLLPASTPLVTVPQSATSPFDLLRQTAIRTDDPIFVLNGQEFALGTEWLSPNGLLIVAGTPLPAGISASVDRIRRAADSYWVLFRNRRTIRNQYMLLLLMMTSLALFAAVWLGLYTSKQVTRPVEALADAMEAIAHGDYGHRVATNTTEELGELVSSFNHMAADLESSRTQIERTTLQLSHANSALEARRHELETMLQTIPNGVVMLDEYQRVVLANRAFSEMLDPGGQRSFLNLPLATILSDDQLSAFDRLIRRSHRMGSASSEMEMPSPRGTLHLSVTVALLETVAAGQHIHHGYVIVLEDATELLRAQRQSAWKEVARRVAHEIKNPLTPISLSSEQIHRHIARLESQLESNQLESPSIATIRRCSEVISSSVESMRALVDQFSSLAEFPMARPRPADVNTILENSLALFAGRMQQVQVRRNLAPHLPLVLADPEALKRAFGNIIDNAVEAMQNALLRELHISTAILSNNMIEVAIGDTGTGVTDEMRERLFLPYFSTKQRGTGLGLAIASKIVQDHKGTIRAENAAPVGARFIIELPLAAAENELELNEPTRAAALTSGDPA